MISHKVGLEQLCGDIGIAFRDAFTKKKVYISKAYIEFGDHAGKYIFIKNCMVCAQVRRDSMRTLLIVSVHLDLNRLVSITMFGTGWMNLENNMSMCVHMQMIL